MPAQYSKTIRDILASDIAISMGCGVTCPYIGRTFDDDWGLMIRPVIIKYPFWKYTLENPDAIYVCVNFGQAYAPKEIAKRSICLDADIGRILSELDQKVVS